MAIKDIVLKLVIDGKESLITLDKLDSKTLGLQKTLKNAAGAMGLAFGAFEVIGFIKDSIALVQRENEVIGKLNATLNSTGFIAGMTSNELVDLANHLEEVNRFKFDDKDIIDAEGLLLTFTKINKQIFPETMQLALDMSVRFDQELKPSIVQIGKALQDPVRGYTALRKVGVSFTEQQEEQIKSFIKQNDLMAAQRIILDELTKQVGGSAKESVDEYTLRVNKLAEAWESVMLVTGKALTYFATDVYDFWDRIILSIGDKLDKLRGVLGLPSDTEWADILGLEDTENKFSLIFPAKIPVSVSTENSQKTIGQIKEEIKQLNESLENTVVGSREYLSITAEIDKLEASITRNKTKQKEEWTKEKDLAEEYYKSIVEFEDELAIARRDALSDDNITTLGDYKKGETYGRGIELAGNTNGKAGGATLEPVFDKMLRESDLFANSITITFDKIWDKMIDGGFTAADILNSLFSSVLDQIGQILSNELFNSLTTKGASGAGSGGSNFIDALFSVVPFLANGGVVSKPTLSMIGESGPEAVIPLERFGFYDREMRVIVEGEISGETIYLSNKRASKSRKRIQD